MMRCFSSQGDLKLTDVLIFPVWFLLQMSYKIGDNVMGMWDDGEGSQNWFKGTVTKVLRQQKGVAREYEVTFDDGDVGSLARTSC
jgi:hypothetical protein